ncbi:helix-turn-helix transcriptional regulator [Derxia gummosa]|uniref:Helix-turn-helix transcriptional regulator n=1 Tax=Derxia gummosa DSM 723 TaxID=1121388 RepID=A0A8B6XC58_9BURK|nr:helix-turn-helix transcriptional regulator [Derxia gummosa]
MTNTYRLITSSKPSTQSFVAKESQLTTIPLNVGLSNRSHSNFIYSQNVDTRKTASQFPEEWKDEEYRKAYVEAAIEQGIPWQIRVNREMRQLSQQKLAELVGTRQSAISRIENEFDLSTKLETLVKYAHAFDCALLVRFVSHSVLALEAKHLSPEALFAASFPNLSASQEGEGENGTGKRNESGSTIGNGLSEDERDQARLL